MNIAATSMARARRLRAATTSAHEHLDNRIMAASPFAGRDRYGRFLQVQYLFHRDIDALYDMTALADVVPDLAERRRLRLIVQDLQDLGVAVPAADTAPAFGARLTDVPFALGWLYVAEGSNLGAAFLLKEAVKLDLSEQFGARHLAAHPKGRGLHWKTFTAALDALTLAEAEDDRAVAGAKDAFARVQGLVEVLLPAESVR